MKFGRSKQKEPDIAQTVTNFLLIINLIYHNMDYKAVIAEARDRLEEIYVRAGKPYGDSRSGLTRYLSEIDCNGTKLGAEGVSLLLTIIYGVT